MTCRISNEVEQVQVRKACEIEANALKDALIEGEKSGETTPFDGEAFLSRMHKKDGCDAT